MLVNNNAPAADDTLAARVAAEGSGAIPWVRALAGNRAAMRDAADAVHALCTVHAGHPSLLDQACARAAGTAVAPWLEHAAIAFTAERSAVALLVAAVGPVPSTPGQGEADIALRGQRRALSLLVASDRIGCALGASIALALDWHVIRPVLDITAERLGATIPQSRMPDLVETDAALTTVAADPVVARALRFGLDQLLAQHRGMWDLLEARAAARDQY